MPWSTLLSPSIALARDGFVVSGDFAKAMDLSEQFAGYDFLSKGPLWARDFAPNGTRVGKGDTMTRKRYARTLQAIASMGADVLYRGPLADDMINAIQESDGILTAKDLRDYRVVSRKPVEIEYKGYRIYACGAPASGSVTLSAMKILEGFKYQVDELKDLNIHRMIEAMRFGYGKVTRFS